MDNQFRIKTKQSISS